MTRFNLGCGSDIRPGYTNVDFIGDNCFRVDLLQLPWPILDEDAEEVLMLDFLEHVPYVKTEQVLAEVWRILKPDGFVDIQCPDFEECARAMLQDDGEFLYSCNRCGAALCGHKTCHYCGQSDADIAQAAMQRLYGGQDRLGNWHYAAFTKRSISLLLTKNGFDRLEFIERNQNGETMSQNWNFKVRAYKNKDMW